MRSTRMNTHKVIMFAAILLLSMNAISYSQDAGNMNHGVIIDKLHRATGDYYIALRNEALSDAAFVQYLSDICESGDNQVDMLTYALYVRSKYPDYASNYDLLTNVLLSDNVTDKDINDALKIIFKDDDNLEQYQSSIYEYRNKMLNNLSVDLASEAIGLPFGRIRNNDMRESNEHISILLSNSTENKAMTLYLVGETVIVNDNVSKASKYLLSDYVATTMMDITSDTSKKSDKYENTEVIITAFDNTYSAYAKSNEPWEIITGFNYIASYNSDDPDTWDAILEGLASDSMAVRASAILCLPQEDALAKIPGLENNTYTALSQWMVTEKDPKIRRNAMIRLGYYDADIYYQFLNEILTTENNPDVIKFIKKSMKNIEDRKKSYEKSKESRKILYDKIKAIQNDQVQDGTPDKQSDETVKPVRDSQIIGEGMEAQSPANTSNPSKNIHDKESKLQSPNVIIFSIIASLVILIGMLILRRNHMPSLK